MLTGVEKFQPFIDGVEFTVGTDHASLKWLQNLKEPYVKLFDFFILHMRHKFIQFVRARFEVDVYDVCGCVVDGWSSA